VCSVQLVAIQIDEALGDIAVGTASDSCSKSAALLSCSAPQTNFVQTTPIGGGVQHSRLMNAY
jgi:hypothetical protein